MAYDPNFKDPRVQSRVKNALGFVRGCFSETKELPWSTRYIDRYLGSQRNDLSKWLRRHLITTTQTHYSKDNGLCKKYLLNKQGYEYVRDRLLGLTNVSFVTWTSNLSLRTRQSLSDLLEISDNDTETITTSLYPSVVEVEANRLVHDWITDEFRHELTTKQFKYQDKSSRLWHPLQRVRRNYKKAAFAEYDLLYQYDIECAAPTLLLQYSQHIPLVVDQTNKYIQGPMDLWLFALNNYLKDKKKYREELALNADITQEQAKIIINALFAGAVISLSPTTEIYQMLNGDHSKIEYLKQDPFLTELRSDIKTMWDYIKVTLPRKTDKLGRMTGISGKQKWILYFDLERKILDLVRKYLSEKSNDFFLEHDGWTCVNPIDNSELIDYIYVNSGFRIKLSCEKLVRTNNLLCEISDNHTETITTSLYPSVVEVETNDR